MAKKVEVSELEKALNAYIEEYFEDIEDEVKKTTDETTKLAIKELKEVSKIKFKNHNKGNPYYKGWSSKISSNKTKYTKKIWNRTNYQLTHLLEFGHATRNGKRTNAVPHIRPIEEKYQVKFTDSLRERIRRKSK